MKKKNLNTKLALKKKTIISLTAMDAGLLHGGNTGGSVQACIPPTEPEGCSNGCPSNDPATCRKTIAHQQTGCCATWVAPCSALITCIG